MRDAWPSVAGPNLHELLPRLSPQARDRPVVEPRRDLLVLQILELGHLVFLAGNIAGILDGNLDLCNYYI